MPDITMCENLSCPQKSSCYRHMATPNQFMQSYCHFEYSGDSCDSYWPLSPVAKGIMDGLKEAIEHSREYKGGTKNVK